MFKELQTVSRRQFTAIAGASVAASTAALAAGQASYAKAEEAARASRTPTGTHRLHHLGRRHRVGA